MNTAVLIKLKESLKNDRKFLVLKGELRHWDHVCERAHKTAGACVTTGYESAASALRVLEFAINKGLAQEPQLQMLLNNALNAIDTTLETLEADIDRTKPCNDTQSTHENVAPHPYIKHILVVDDDPVIRMLVVNRMEKLGFSVSEAIDGVDGVEKARTLTPDLILMDCGMPNLDGFGAIEEIRKQRHIQSTPIFMLTGMDDAEHREQGNQLGVKAYILKPFTAESIMGAINTL